VDLLASNVISATRAQELFNDASAAGDTNCNSLRSLGNITKNVARDLRRKLLKGNMWPKLYVANIRVLNTKEKIEEVQKMSFLLPHEVLGVMQKIGKDELLFDRSSYDPMTLQHLRHCEAQAKSKLVGIGLWGDGAPCNWDRTETMEVLSWNLAGAGGVWKKLRIPITGLSKKHVASSSTYDDLFEVISWSLQALAIGQYPKQRHDGSAWLPSDARRNTLASSGASLIKAALVEVRGDWKFYKEVFHFPAWNDASGMCWFCTCKPENIRQVGLEAPWRTNRCSHYDMLRRILASGAMISKLFSVPWISTSIFKVDWLHAVDQGVAADFAGNILLYLIKERLPGPNQTSRCEDLWRRLQKWYVDHGIGDRLQNLTLSMLCKQKGYPKLRCSAAQMRAMVPWLQELATTLLVDDNPKEEAMKSGIYHLHQCYQALSSSSIFFDDILSRSSRLFAAQYVALEASSIGTRFWRIKPKLHLFLELAASGSQPSSFWCYRDEDFGGACAHMARRRGGLARAGPTSSTLLHRWRMRNPVPRLV